MSDKSKGNTYIYTDGACSGNGKANAIGGWAFVCDRYTSENGGGRVQTTRYGGETNATNNKMELKAVLEGLKYFYTTMDIFEALIICSDSKYVTKCINEKWYIRWQNNGWKNSNGEPVANKELWEKILFYIREIGEKTILFKWVKGHNGNLFNETADRLAVKGLQEVKQKTKEEKENRNE